MGFFCWHAIKNGLKDCKRVLSIGLMTHFYFESTEIKKTSVKFLLQKHYENNKINSTPQLALIKVIFDAIAPIPKIVEKPELESRNECRYIVDQE